MIEQPAPPSVQDVAESVRVQWDGELADELRRLKILREMNEISREDYLADHRRLVAESLARMERKFAEQK